jgi:tetratricopeptide (TPR) repeat protein
MQQQSFISRWCERIIEAGWLLALSLIPIYFNLLSARHFEPDKATTLRAIVLIMAAAALVRALERLNARAEPGGTRRASGSGDAARDGPSSENPFAALWQRLNNVPLAIPILFYALIFVVTTITSVIPHTSFWGSYQRLQGTYTNLSYIALFFLIVATLRRREQIDRLLIVTILSGLVVATYGVMQHFQLDPLPWQGDVITRVASTMGNAIFVAAYLIMVLPLVLYRAIVSGNAARQAPASSSPRDDILGAVASVALVFGTLALLWGVIKFGAIIRTSDFRYWWVLPGAIVTVTALWTLLGPRQTNEEGQPAVALWPGIIYMSYILFFGLVFALSASGQQQQIGEGPNTALAQDWWLWMLMSIVSVGLFYVLSFMLPRRTTTASRLNLTLQSVGTGGIALILLLAIIFSQSRGPWIGMGAGLFVFVSLLLWQGMRHARAHEQQRFAKRLRVLLGAWIGLTLLAGSFLIVFNVSDATFFNRLRGVPYIGRMGQLLEVEYGTGRVRTLIWTGDEHAGGAVSLITADPLRTLIGWGPESMFVAYNAFYPPELATIEDRGASPDRSHQAILDELVTKGFLGLISYFFVLISVAVLSWRLIRRSDDWHWQVLFMACLSSVVAHVVEGLTGIPIVSTLMMFWVILAAIVTGGMLAGHYTIGAAAQPTPADASTPEETTPEESTPAKGSGKKRKGSTRSGRRGTPARGGPARASRRQEAPQTNPAALGVYAIIFAITLAAVWWFNLSTVYADMRFNEGQAISQQNTGLNAQAVALEKFIETINSNPREDFYYLNLGRTLMTIADQKRSQGSALGNEIADPEVSDLLDLEDRTAVATFVQTNSPLELMSYARAVLREARALNPMNKDHYANLARLNNFWFNWTRDVSKLRNAAQWYQQANEIAPQDVTLLNEHAGVQMLLATFAGNQEGAPDYTEQATQLLERSRELDPSYFDTTVRLAELYRVQGDLEQSAALYEQIIRQEPQRVDPALETLIGTFIGQPDLLLGLRDAYREVAESQNNARYYSVAGLLSVRGGEVDTAVGLYEQATARAPNNLEHRRNYTLVLSDTERYDQALAEAEAGLEIAQTQEGAEQEAAQFRFLVNILQPKVAGGE